MSEPSTGVAVGDSGAAGPRRRAPLGSAARRVLTALMVAVLSVGLSVVAPTSAVARTAPTAFEGSFGDAAIGLQWAHPVGSGRAGYNIYRSTTLPVSVTQTPVNGGTLVTGQAYTNTGLTNGRTYHYVIETVDTAGGKSAPTAPVTLTPRAAPAPTGSVTWTTRASSALARAEANGAAANGKMYVFGGQYSGITQTLRSDRYDPATDTWTRIADLPELITHAPVVVDGNTLWIIGGYLGLDKKDSTNHVWKYNTTTNTYSAGPALPAPRGGGGAAIVGRQLHYFSGAVRRDSIGAATIDMADHYVLNLDGGTSWTSSSPMPNPRNHLAAAAIGNTVYLIGGQHGEHEGTTAQQQVDAYDVATGIWSRKADLPVPRGHISASTFPLNGKIITVGGSVVGSNGGNPSNTLFEYDPATNAWRTLTPLPGARKSPVADIINGTIVVNGGRTTSAPSTTTWSGVLAGSPATTTGAWSTAAAAPQSVLDAGGTELGGKIYLVGGKTSAGPHNTVRVFDPSSQVWTTLASKPGTAVENPAVVGHNGMLYSVGGSSGAFTGAVNSLYRFNPATNTWTTLPSMPTARGGAAAVVVNGVIWVVGGMNSSGASLNTTERFDIATGRWSSGPAMITPRDNPGLAVVNGTIYAFGGRTRLSNGTEQAPRLTSTESLAAGATGWTARASMPTGRRAMAVGVLNGKIIAAGGEKQADGRTFPQTEEYNPLTNTWRSLAPMRSPRHGAVAAVRNGVLHVIGGGTTGGSSYSTIHEVFKPSS
jgi:N-acetylneuraminic acid mutarotase